jgi:hypothetical protein
MKIYVCFLTIKWRVNNVKREGWLVVIFHRIRTLVPWNSIEKTVIIQSELWIDGGVRVMVFNATLNNISVISWWSVLLGEETGLPEENHRPVASHWQTLLHNAVLSTLDLLKKPPIDCCLMQSEQFVNYMTFNRTRTIFVLLLVYYDDICFNWKNTPTVLFH